jgi:subtilisin family serine protease
VVACTTAVVAASATATRAAEDSVAAEYVVSFSGSPDAAAAAIQAAGGSVVDVTEQVGLALVSSADGAFLDSVRASSEIRGAARNHSVGITQPNLPHRYAEERPSGTDGVGEARSGSATASSESALVAEPLADLQWDMDLIGATPDGAHQAVTGKGVDVGIIDTGIDGRHPDLAPNFDAERSRNFTTDVPEIDGPCEVESCVDPADVDHNGHGTHVAGTVAAASNDFGIAGVAPEATLVNLRAGQDSGYFFLYETVQALVHAGDLGLDVVNMSFYTDPWRFNCTSPDEYVEGTVTDEELTQQQLVHDQVLAAVAYAHDRGVTLIGAAGNEHQDLAAPTRVDATSPNYPVGTAHPRTVQNTCLNLPSEAPQVISVSAVGPSGTKADYSNYGLGDVEVSAPGGWARDFVGTPEFQSPANLVLSSYPLQAAIDEGLADPDGQPLDARSVSYCDGDVCGFYTYLQGTSMAAPHVAGIAALIVEDDGGEGPDGPALAPEDVAGVLAGTAVDHACPEGGVEDYTDEGRTPDFNAVCEGTTEVNGLYGEGIVSATAAVED